MFGAAVRAQMVGRAVAEAASAEVAFAAVLSFVVFATHYMALQEV